MREYVPSIHLPSDYFTWDRTIELTELLGPRAEALPIRLWLYCAKNAQMDGKLAHEAMAGLERRLQWWGEKGLATKTLKDSLFLMYAGDYHVVVDWPEVGGHILKARAKSLHAINSRWNHAPRNTPSITPSIGWEGAAGGLSSARPPRTPNDNTNDRRITHD
jgi:hypothetical protein